jgi:hypothetical protein
VTLAFGEAPGAPRLFGEKAENLPPPPYLVFEEPAEQLEFESADELGVAHAFGQGQLTAGIVAAGKKQARDLGRLVAATLRDAPLTFQDGVLLEIRPRDPYSPRIDDPGVGSPARYQRIVEFYYVVQRSS